MYKQILLVVMQEQILVVVVAVAVIITQITKVAMVDLVLS